MEEYISVGYETITTAEKRKLAEPMNSSLLNAFNEDDFYSVMAVFARVIERLEAQ